MKKVTAVISIILIFLICGGCHQQIKPSPIQKEFTAKVECGEEVYTVTHNGTSITTVSYENPIQLQGITYSYVGSDLTIKYGELHYQPSSEIPENNIVQLHKILCSVNDSTEDNIKSCDEEHTVYTMRTYDITCTTKDGTIEKISARDTGRIYTFSSL